MLIIIGAAQISKHGSLIQFGDRYPLFSSIELIFRTADYNNNR